MIIMLQYGKIRVKAGFTLVEIMIVIIVIGILATISLPMYQKTVERSRIAEATSMLGAIRTAQVRYASEHNSFTNVLADLDVNISNAGKFFDFSAFDIASPFDAGDGSLAGAARNTLGGGSYGGCSGYSINISEMGNFSSPDCPELNSILN